MDKITVGCYYSGDADYTGELLHEKYGPDHRTFPSGPIVSRPQELERIAGLETRTVHGIIGREADLAFIITGRNDAPQTPKNWMFQTPTGNVSISRGKQLLN